METFGICGRCGGQLTLGQCLRCEHQSKDRVVHRELIVLAVLAVVTIAAFFATRSFAAANQALRLQDARSWHMRGDQMLQRGDIQAALEAFRQAAAKDPDAPAYRLSLATALIAGQQDQAARQVLVDLREQQPEDPETNLELARLEARHGDHAAVGRYYETAIVGLWKVDQRQAQRQLRTEFIEFLLSHGERDRALSELLVLEAGLPVDVPSQLAVGQLLLAAGDARRAGDHFAQVLRLDPTNSVALAGAGESSFELGDYLRARQSFGRLTSDTDRSRELRTLTELVLGTDALAPRLQITERRRRLATGFAQVVQRLDACHSRALDERQEPSADVESALAAARGFEAALNARGRPNTFDEIEAGFDLVYRGERIADRTCGSPDPLDRALVLIGQRHGLDDQ